MTSRRTRVMRWGAVGVALWLCAGTWFVAHAATGFANPGFEAQWKSGEAIAPNFWGPLASARDGQQEPYKEATGGTRLVQYFDKGRMELTNGAVTNGLLATELVKGRVQTGDTTFENRPPPAIAIAGDLDNPGPTYAMLASKGTGLFDAAPAHVGNVTQAIVSPSGDIGASDTAGTPPTTFALYDDTTKHNVPQAFADYRAKAGIPAIGFALCEPFLATVKVAGAQKPVMVQVFERRVLTYTASNTVAFQVEMGNIGQHYYQWRNPSGTANAAAPSAAPALSPTALPRGKFNPTVTPDPSVQFAVTASLDPPTPDTFSTPVVTAKLTRNGQGVAGATMETSWHLKGADVYCSFGPSGDDGTMSCAHIITKAIPGVPCTIDIFVSYGGQLYTTSVNFTPKRGSTL